VLLHVLRSSLSSGGPPRVPDSPLALAEACVRYTRQSYSLLSNSWIDGSLVAFDYCDTQYLFSTATVLAVSALWGRNQSCLDKDRFDCLASFLQQLRDNGNLPAEEFMKHITAIIPLVESVMQQRTSTDVTPAANPPGAQVPHNFDDQNNADILSASGDMLLDPFFQDLLAQPVADLHFIEEAMTFNEDNALYWSLENGQIGLENL
jgi:proline utilization trans-activator